MPAVIIADRAFDLASEQGGIFTSSQAAAQGISASALVMAERRGHLRRVSRGIYRLVRFPIDEEIAQLWEAVLWPTVSRGDSSAPGVISHLSALALHYPKLSYSPPKVSVTIEPGLRIRREIPPWLSVHFAHLAVHDLDRIRDLPVTGFRRTVADCIAAKIDRRFIIEAVDALDDVDARRLVTAQMRR